MLSKKKKKKLSLGNSYQLQVVGFSTPPKKKKYASPHFLVQLFFFCLFFMDSKSLSFEDML